jgi:hypothetical protein
MVLACGVLWPEFEDDRGTVAMFGDEAVFGPGPGLEYWFCPISDIGPVTGVEASPTWLVAGELAWLLI